MITEVSTPRALSTDHGTLYLVPNTLDFGSGEPLPLLTDVAVDAHREY